MEQNLDTKLTRIENTISLMKTNLQLSENEVIEKVAEATNLHTLANIFIQEEEPEIKEGIWIQADSETHPYDTIKIDKDIVIPDTWRFDKKAIQTINGSYRPYNSSESCYHNYVIFNGKHYIAVDYTMYEMDPDTGSLTSIGGLSGRGNLVAAGGKYVCHYGSNAAFAIDCFNLETNTRTVVNAPKTFETMCYCPYDGYFYVWGSSISLCKFNPDTKEFVSMSAKGINYCANLIPVGSQILAIGKTDRWGVYNGLFDIENGYAYTSLSSKLDVCMAGDYYNNAVVVGDSAYLAVYNNPYSTPPAMTNVFKIDLNTWDYQVVTDEFNSDDLGVVLGFAFDSQRNAFYVINRDKSSSRYYSIPMDCNSTQYDKNSIIIMQSPITKSEKQTALWTYSCLEGRMCQSFFDVYYYNKETGFDFTLPIHYGNGTEWVKFKG
jgi:hypothetical protein